MGSTDYVLRRIHPDVAQMDVLSSGGNRYFVTFVGDCSRKLGVIQLRTRLKRLTSSNCVSHRLSGDSDQRALTLRTDKGGEYFGKLFQEYLRKPKVRHQLLRRSIRTELSS